MTTADVAAPAQTEVAPLRNFGRHEGSLAGGKGANLGELVRAGLRVPDGFLVTTAAYAAAVGHLPLVLDSPEDAERLRAAVTAVSINQELCTSITEAYATLGGGSVSVRSSATAEDLPGAAFAGQQDTFLNVVGAAEVVDAVRRCWASLWTDRAIDYRARRGIAPDEVSMAVVVQRMVEPDLAGVMFTANPVSGDRRQRVVDASPGLGEAVVSGLVTPDHYVLDENGAVLDWTPGRREVVIRSDPGGGVRHTDAESTADRLPEHVLAELARLGAEVQTLFGRPQDIEWAWADGRVWLLQARPMTALPPPPLRLGAFQRRMAGIGTEYFPVRPYPIDVTTWLPYGPAGGMGQVAAYYGIHVDLDRMFEEEDGVVARLTPDKPTLSPRIVALPWRLIARARRYDPARWTEDPRFRRFRADVAELDAADPATLRWPQLIDVLTRALDLGWPITALRIDFLPGAGLALARLAIVATLLGRRRLLGDLLAGAATHTQAFNNALTALAERASHDAEVRAAVERLDPALVTGTSDFSTALRDFLAEYGHRETTSLCLVSTPTLVEDPQAVLSLVKVLLDVPPAAPELRANDALERLYSSRLLRRPALRRRVGRWVRAGQAGIAFREDSHLYWTLPVPALRGALLEIGRRLVAADVLTSAEDVFHLRLDEITGLAEPDRLSAAERAHLTALVRQRSAKREELTGVRLIDPGSLGGRPPAGNALVSGTPASGGRVTGPVAVVHGPAEFGGLRTGDVLVCPYTNPSWTPLFQRAAAVVVDAGSTASHAAIVAREYGIPAVMGTLTGTEVLHNGQRVTVDGNLGQVTPAAD